MKLRHISFLLSSVALLTLAAPSIRSQDAQRVSPPRNWGLAFTRYSEFRADYDSLPVKVVNIRGGKLSPHEKFKVEVMGVSNRSNKSVTAAEFTWYLFDNTDLDKAVDSGKTSLMDFALAPNEQQKCQILILHIEDIPFLRDKNPAGTFLLEVAVTKVTYSDGSTWEAAGIPGKFDYSKVRR
jgi:hypothetical protein